MDRPVKPLGRKAYGSIPHLPGSRMGPADHSCHEGQARIATESKRDKNDRIIVQEKLDGSCVAVAKVDGDVVALGRAGYLASTSPYEQHHLFDVWVKENVKRLDLVLSEGERIVGEWLAQAHGTRYDLGGREPFVPFDVMYETTRYTWQEVLFRMHAIDLQTPMVLNDTENAISISDAMTNLNRLGFYGAVDPVEGAVWRVERNGEVDFLVKYVRPDKVDGLYLPEISGKEIVWNWRPANAT